MTPEEHIRRLLDPYFAHLRAKGSNRHAAKEPPYSVEDGGVPPAMADGEPDHEGYVAWKVLPSTVTDKAIARIEKRVRGPFPPLFRAYLKYGHFLGTETRVAWLPGTPSDDPLGPLTMYIGGSAEIIDAGYVAFGWGPNDIGMICFDYGSRLADGDCPIVLFDHDELVDLDEADLAVRAKVQPFAQAFAPSFAELAARAFAV